MKPLLPLCLLVALSHARAEDVQLDRLTLKDGRTLTGTYDHLAGTVSMSHGGAKASISVKPDDIIKVERITGKADAAPNEDPKAKGERQIRLVKGVLSSIEAKLPPNPRAAIAAIDVDIGARVIALDTQIATYNNHVAKRNEYARELALKETSTTTTAVDKWTGSYDVAAADNRGHVAGAAARGQGARGQTVTTTVDVSAAKRALIETDAALKQECDSLWAADTVIKRQRGARAELFKLIVEHDKLSRHLAELERNAVLRE